MIKPAGYYVLVKMETLDKKDDEKIEGSSVIIAAPKTQKENRDLAEREQKGHFRGTLVALGPTAWSGYQGIDMERMADLEPAERIQAAGVGLLESLGNIRKTPTTAEERAAQWGVKIGDVVRFQRYDGVDEGDEYRLVQDGHIIGVIEE